MTHSPRPPPAHPRRAEPPRGRIAFKSPRPPPASPPPPPPPIWVWLVVLGADRRPPAPSASRRWPSTRSSTRRCWSCTRRLNPREEIVGWYATGTALNVMSVLVHDFYGRSCEQPVHLTLDNLAVGGLDEPEDVRQLRGVAGKALLRLAVPRGRHVGHARRAGGGERPGSRRSGASTR